MRLLPRSAFVVVPWGVVHSWILSRPTVDIRNLRRVRLQAKAGASVTGDGISSSSTRAQNECSRKNDDNVGNIANSIERHDVEGLSPSQVRDMVDFSRPCVLTGVLSAPDCEWWCDALMEDLGDAQVDFQVRDNEEGTSDVFEASLEDFVRGLQDESSHNSSW